MPRKTLHKIHLTLLWLTSDFKGEPCSSCIHPSAQNTALRAPQRDPWVLLWLLSLILIICPFLLPFADSWLASVLYSSNVNQATCWSSYSLWTEFLAYPIGSQCSTCVYFSFDLLLLYQEQSYFSSIFSHIKDQFSSVTQSFPTLCDPMNHSTPGLLIHY